MILKPEFFLQKLMLMLLSANYATRAEHSIPTPTIGISSLIWLPAIATETQSGHQERKHDQVLKALVLFSIFLKKIFSNLNANVQQLQ